jgi:hypothetical protein
MRRPIVACIFVALVSCGKQETLPEKPQLRTDRDSIGFGQEFGTGTYIGTAPQESLLLENQGIQTLTISAVTPQMDPEFKVEGPVDASGKTTLDIPGRGRAFLRVIFTPKIEKTYSGSIIIKSNAENTPEKVITVSGRGLKPPADGGP